MDKIKVGETYYKDGKEVVVIEIGEILLGKQHYNGVIFKNDDGKIIIEKIQPFQESIIPTKLNVKDEVVATCMGKILATYTIQETTDKLSMGISIGGNKMNFYTKIYPNGFVKPSTQVDCLSKQMEYIFVSPQLKRKLAIGEQINSCLSKISNIRSRLSSKNIDYQNTNIEDIRNIDEDIQDLNVRISNKIKFLQD